MAFKTCLLPWFRLGHVLLWGIFHSFTAIASEVCMIPFGSEYLMFYFKCPDYCCRYKNATQYCCSDCSRSINSDSCTPEQMWRYILYVGLGIAGGVILCYTIAFILKNYKEPMKHACCKHWTTRVQDPIISLTSTSAWAGALTSDRPNMSRRPSNPDDNWAAAVCSRPCPDPYSRPPPPPAYAVASAASGDCQCLREAAATPPPVYSDAAEAPVAMIAAAEANSREPPPAYSELESQPLQR